MNNILTVIISQTVIAKGTILWLGFSFFFSTKNTTSELRPRWTLVTSACKSNFHGSPVRCLPPQTRLNPYKSPYNGETRGHGRIQTKTAEFKGPKLGPAKCFCHWPTTAVQLAVSFCCPVSVIDGWWWTSEESLTSLCVRAHALPHHTNACTYPWMPVSTSVYKWMCGHAAFLWRQDAVSTSFSAYN